MSGHGRGAAFASAAPVGRDAVERSAGGTVACPRGHCDGVSLYSLWAGERRRINVRTRVRTAKGPVMTVRTAVLLSGGGRSLENLLDRIERGSLTNVDICCVVASKASAGGLEKARRRGIASHVLRPKDFPSSDAMSEAVSSLLDCARVDLAVLAGWMHFYRIPARYRNKVMNIHPSLIPAFCGKGCYGERVHAAALEFGAKVSGCTVHFADNEFDHGPIIVQRVVEVEEGDSVETLAARVFEEEKEALPDAVQMFADGVLRVEGRLVRISKPSLIP